MSKLCSSTGESVAYPIGSHGNRWSKVVRCFMRLECDLNSLLFPVHDFGPFVLVKRLIVTGPQVSAEVKALRQWCEIQFKKMSVNEGEI